MKSISEIYEQENRRYGSALVTKTMNVEYDAMLKNQTWDIVPCLKLINVIVSKWVYKKKINSIEAIEKFK